jgi:hypothetical protein
MLLTRQPSKAFFSALIFFAMALSVGANPFTDQTLLDHYTVDISGV